MSLLIRGQAPGPARSGQGSPQRFATALRSPNGGRPVSGRSGGLAPAVAPNRRELWRNARLVLACPARTRPLAAALSAEELLIEQEDVQAGDEGGHPGRDPRRQRAVHVGAHDVAAPREQDERDQRERDPEREHDLAEDER